MALRVKGGVNLRLFHGSVRYSEDLDLDADARLRGALKRHLHVIVREPAFLRNLAAIGIREIDLSERPAKDTETVLRCKYGLMVGGVRYPTKIEISYRGDTPVIWAGIAVPDSTVVRRYLPTGVASPELGSYGRTGAIWQKLYALYGRVEMQARDVFDLDVLLTGQRATSSGSLALGSLRRCLTDEVLQVARERALAFTIHDFRTQVATYLLPPGDQEYTTHWVGTQIRVASFIDDILAEPLAAGEQPAIPPRDPAGSQSQHQPEPGESPRGRRHR